MTLDFATVDGQVTLVCGFAVVVFVSLLICLLMLK